MERALGKHILLNAEARQIQFEIEVRLIIIEALQHSAKDVADHPSFEILHPPTSPQPHTPTPHLNISNLSGRDDLTK